MIFETLVLKILYSSPRNQEQKNAVFRFIRFSLQKEQEANDSFNRLSKVLDELDIPVLYSSGVLQSELQSARKEPEWSRNHGVHFFSKGRFTSKLFPSKKTDSLKS